MAFESRRSNLATVRELILFLLRRNPDGFAPYKIFEFVQEETGCTPELAREYTSTVFNQLKKEEVVEKCDDGFRIKDYEPKVSDEDLKIFDECNFYLHSQFGGFVQQWMLRQVFFRRVKKRDSRLFDCLLRLRGYVPE